MKTRCNGCNGHGEIATGQTNGMTACAGVWTECPDCVGFGFVFQHDCTACMDTGLDIDATVFDAHAAIIRPVACPHCTAEPVPPAPRFASYDVYSAYYADDLRDAMMGAA